MNIVDRCYPERSFGGYTRVDGTVAFYGRILQMLSPGMTVLNLGCGRGANIEPSGLKDLTLGGLVDLHGADVDEDAKVNPFIHQFHLLRTGEQWALESESYDLAYCDHVVEHVEDAEAFFHEVHRIMKPGGVLAIRTPNKWGYVAIV